MCEHIDIEILGINTDVGLLQLECIKCRRSVEIVATTLPAMQGFAQGQEFQNQVAIEAKMAATLALRDYDALTQ